MKHRDKDMPFTREDLEAAAAEVRVGMLDSMPPPSGCEQQFSEEFLKNMRAAMIEERRRRKKMLILNLVVAAALTAIVIAIAVHWPF